MMNRKLLLAAGLALGLSSGALAVAYGVAPGDPFAPCRADNMVDFSELGGGFELTDETGAMVTDKDVITRPTLFYIGYTFCPDVCPTDNMRNADAIYLLEERGIDSQAVFASFDPKRDTPEVLAEFTDVFHPGMIGLTGSVEEVRALAETFASRFLIRNAGDEEFYLFDHTTFSYIILPGHGVVDIVRRDEPPEAVVERMSCLIAAG